MDDARQQPAFASANRPVGWLSKPSMESLPKPSTGSLCGPSRTGRRPVLHLAALCLAMLAPSAHATEAPCRIIKSGTSVALESPQFVLRLDTAAGLTAQSWLNRRTGHCIALGGGPELGLEVGEPARAERVTLRVVQCPEAAQGPRGRAAFKLSSEQPGISAAVVYEWNANDPVLRKTVEIANAGPREIRVLNLWLADYPTAAKAVAREQGFPVYLNDEFFLSLAHPAGWAQAEGGHVLLRQYPGVKLAPGATFRSMEAVYGVGDAGAARQALVAHVRSRMRRVVRGHDRPYAIFEPFGARPNGNFDETEEFLLDNITKLAQSQRETGCRFDYYSIDFWVDFNGDLKRCDPVRFPNGLTKILAELKKLGIAPGLWIDSSMTHWSVGGNPAVRPTLNHDPAGPAPAVPIMCRATEPIRSMYVEAFRHHIRHNGVRCLKFDNLHSVCNNPAHNHLPGIYSTEAIQNAVIEFLHAMDAECPDVFLMLYWGHRSPWWLLHADTLFDSGIGIEAASPSDFPSPFARDSITQKLDQAQWHASDVPPLGKDSLGVWLSDWGWNSSVGKERWQEGFVMDLTRGSLLAQPWSDFPWLSPPERKQMADFIALLRARSGCFANPRFILGNPWKDEPYGYCLSDGERTFLALNNCTWKDVVLPLELNASWGLPGGRSWQLFRWHPDPAELHGSGGAFGPKVRIALRPFEVVLLEVVPTGERPSLGRAFAAKPIPEGFAEASRAVSVSVDETKNEPRPELDPLWNVLRPSALRSSGGATLTLQKDGTILAGGANPACDTYTVTADTDVAGITGIRLEAFPDASLPGRGPGRAVNGNFMLNEFRIEARPRFGAGAKASVPVELRNAKADFSQDSHGGWPVAAAIDGNPATGWSIDPAEGLSHVAVFETNKPLGFSAGTQLTFTLRHGEREHNLGCWRLAVTSAKPLFPLPKGYGPKTTIVRGQAPASAAGGLLVVTAEMRRAGSPMAVSNVGSHFSAEGTLGGRNVTWTPVLGKATYPAPWQAWRVVLPPGSETRPFVLRVTTTLAGNVDWKHSAQFVPR